MLNQIIKRIKSTLGITNKKSDMVFTIETLNELVKTDLMTENTAITEFIKAGVGSDGVVEALKVINPTVKSDKDAIHYINENYAMIEEMGKTLLEMVMENFGKIIVTDNMSAKEVALYSLAETYNFIIGAHSDLIMYMVYNSSDTFIYKKKKEWVRLELREYYYTMRELKRVTLKKTFKDIDSMSDVIVTNNPDLLNELTSKNDRNIKLPRNNFDGNPITTFGKWWVDVKIAKAEKLEYDTKLIKLRLNSLREIAENGGMTTALSQQIEYYEAKVVELDKKIIDILGD